MSDDADHPLAALRGFDALHDYIECLAVERSETFVEEQALQALLAAAFAAEAAVLTPSLALKPLVAWCSLVDRGWLFDLLLR